MSAAALRDRANRTRALWAASPAKCPKIASQAASIADPDERARFLASHDLAERLRNMANALTRSARLQYLAATDPKRRAPRK